MRKFLYKDSNITLYVVADGISSPLKVKAQKKQQDKDKIQKSNKDKEKPKGK